MKPGNEKIQPQVESEHQASAPEEQTGEDATPRSNAADSTVRDLEKFVAELALPEETRTLPFIMPHAWEKVVVEDWHDEPMQVHIALLCDIATTHLLPEEQREIEVTIERAIEGLPKSFALPEAHFLELSYAGASLTFLAPALVDRLTVKQRRWLHNGLYAQVGFSVTDGNSFFDLDRPIATAMTLLDVEVVGSNSVFMKDHNPKKVVGYGDRDLAFEIGLVFDPRIGVADWNNSLIPIRNELLVKIGAALRNLDPDAAYSRFVEEKHEYFLDFVFDQV